MNKSISYHQFLGLARSFFSDGAFCPNLHWDKSSGPFAKTHHTIAQTGSETKAHKLQEQPSGHLQAPIYPVNGKLFRKKHPGAKL